MLNELIQRDPYQFKSHIGISIARGWGPLFTKLCEGVDAVTRDDPRGLHYRFHWIQAKEKFGAGRLHWEISGFKARCNALVNAAQSRTTKICIICGAEPAMPDDSGGYLLNLCEHHTKLRKSDPASLGSPWDLERRILRERVSLKKGTFAIFQ
jgi:hypothetical protein